MNAQTLLNAQSNSTRNNGLNEVNLDRNQRMSKP